MAYKMLDPPVSSTGELQRACIDCAVTVQVTGAVGSYNATLDILFSYERLFSCPKIKDERNKVLKLKKKMFFFSGQCQGNDAFIT